jgi:hypothetical protein
MIVNQKTQYELLKKEHSHVNILENTGPTNQSQLNNNIIKGQKKPIANGMLI